MPSSKPSKADREAASRFRALLDQPTCQGVRGAACGRPFLSAAHPDGASRHWIVGGRGLPDWPICDPCAAPLLVEIAEHREKVFAQRRAEGE